MDDFHSLWSHRWLNPKTEVRDSNICARGVFAKEKINKGEIIRVTGGIIVPKTDVDKYNQLMNYVVDNIALDISDEFLMAPTREDLELTALINHSCSPNSGFRDTVTIVAIKDIEPNEEICWDYAFSQTLFPPFKCNCKTSNCRGTINPDDWKIKSIQEEYGNYFSPYLKTKFE
jgi:SET domain-containing protein